MESNGRTTTTASQLFYWQVGMDGVSRLFRYDVSVDSRGDTIITKDIFRERPKHRRCGTSKRKTSESS